jgi:exosome complex RNA-binding protein Rrp4
MSFKMNSKLSRLKRLNMLTTNMIPNLMEKMNIQFLVGLNGIIWLILDLGIFFSE